MTWLLFILFLAGDGPTVIRPADFRHVVEKFLQEDLRREGFEAEITFKSLPKEMLLPGGNYSLRTAQREPVKKKGYCGVPVEVLRDGNVEQTVLCSVFIRTYEDVYVFIRTAGKHELLDPSFLTVRRIETTTMDDIVAPNEDIRGLRTKRMVGERSVLRRSLVEEAPAVLRDRAVSVMVKSGNVVIGASGIAKNDGRIGEEITIQRSGSRALVRATVVGQQIVEIEVQ